jgi:hypothetical protein
VSHIARYWADAGRDQKPDAIGESGTTRLLLSDVDGAEPDAAAIGRVVTTVVAPVTC